MLWKADTARGIQTRHSWEDWCVELRLAEDMFDAFLAEKAAQVGEPLSMLSEVTQRLSRGWAFYYQSSEYIQTGDFTRLLVGHGPVVICDDGQIVEGGSLDRDPEALLTR